MAAIIPALGAASGGLFAGGATAIYGGISAISALTSIGQGIAASRRQRTEAAFAFAEAEQEMQAGAERARQLAKEYAQLRGEQTVIQLANGVDISVGTPVSIARATMREADRSFAATKADARRRAMAARLRGRGLMSDARASVTAGFAKAIGTGLDAYRMVG